MADILERLVQEVADLRRRIAALEVRDKPFGIVEIKDVVLTAMTGSVTFTVPARYKHLLLVSLARTSDTSPRVGRMRFNNDAGLNYDYGNITHVGTAVSAQAVYGENSFPFIYLTNALAMIGSFAGSLVFILDYQNTSVHKLALILNARNDTGGIVGQVREGWWRSMAVINTILLYPEAGSFVAGSRFTLYGIG